MTTVDVNRIPPVGVATAADTEIYASLDALIQSLRPIFQSEGGDAKVLSVTAGVARIAFGGGEGCGGGISGMEGGLRLIIQERVPGVKDVIFE